MIIFLQQMFRKLNKRGEKMEIEDKLKNLEGITYSEWQKIKLVIDNRFAEIKLKSTFNINEDTLKQLKTIS